MTSMSEFSDFVLVFQFRSVTIGPTAVLGTCMHLSMTSLMHLFICD